ncbi:MAG: hypothetical protein JJT96_00935 [Opitutales bacterium]|nr:hypothetical protein [Opitutales bacterium]
MKLNIAVEVAKRGFARMEKAFKRPLFDEWAIIAVRPDSFEVLHYSGGREDRFATEFAEDSVKIRAMMGECLDNPGHFEFVRDADGAQVDAFIVAGIDRLLICNNGTYSMNQITKDPMWTAAQEPFLLLAEKFRADPLEGD